jgi:hypothetical protein
VDDVATAPFRLRGGGRGTYNNGNGRSKEKQKGWWSRDVTYWWLHSVEIGRRRADLLAELVAADAIFPTPLPANPTPAQECEAWMRDGDLLHEAAQRVERRRTEAEWRRQRIAEHFRALRELEA